MKTTACETLDVLETTCRELEKNTPYEDVYQSFHWSETLSMIKEFNIDITNEIITCLSLSRFFGPTPCLTEIESNKLWNFLWPNGNPKGCWFTWGELAESLTEYKNSK